MLFSIAAIACAVLLPLSRILRAREVRAAPDTTLLVRGLALDYLPGREPASTPVYRIHVLSREAHARLIHDQFDKLMDHLDDLSRQQESIQQAAAAIRADKEWEAQQGFRRAWVAHIHHMAPAAQPFIDLEKSGWKPSPEMANPANYPLQIDTPAGSITELGTRRNLRTLLEYLEGWLRGRGAKGIDSMAGQLGSRPALSYLAFSAVSLSFLNSSSACVV